MARFAATVHHSEPIQELVESGESVVIRWWALIRERIAADVEARTPPIGPQDWASLRQ